LLIISMLSSASAEMSNYVHTTEKWIYLSLIDINIA
jgi:hypothetical protein